MPIDGWVCFHCGERFRTEGAARDHFGETPQHYGQIKDNVISLFDAIKHGDDEHKAWLKEAIEDHFAGREVKPPKGIGK